MADPEVIPPEGGGDTPAADTPAVDPLAAIPSLAETRFAPGVEDVAVEPPVEPAADPAAEPVAAVPTEDAPKESLPSEAVPPEAVATPEPAAPPVLEPIVYEAYEPPEGITLDAERVHAIDEKLAAARVPAELRSDLYNEYVTEIRRLDEHYQREQWRVFNEHQRAEQEKVQNDPALWRPGLQLEEQPAIAAAVRMIDAFVPPAQREAFDDMMRTTGTGNRHVFMQFLSNIAKKFDAPVAPLAPTNPPPDRGGARGAGRRLSNFYDNPRSKAG